jgi:serine/threonine protein kinase
MTGGAKLMSTNSDLASWGEPPTTPVEEALGTLLDKVLTKIERGKAVKPGALRGNHPELIERGQELVRTVSLLYQCVASVWENSWLEPGDRPGNSPRYSTLGLSSVGTQRPVKREAEMQVSADEKAGGIPDPFPGEFAIRRLLGEGSFGKVLLADELKLGRQVALKTLKVPASSTVGPEILAALRKEAQHLAKLNHPNIVQVYAWREARGEYYLVLQFVAGGSLGDRLKKEKVLDWQQAARYIADVAEALLEAHKCGVVHRDIKPDNILWNPDSDEAVLTDFGVSARLAEPGTVAGTPMYMAPEAFKGDVTPALDVYSLSVTLYHLMTGKLPFAQAAIPKLLEHKLQGMANPDLQCGGMPEPLERIVRAGLAGKADKRPRMADFLAGLRGSLNQLMADVLTPPSTGRGTRPPVNLRLVVSRREEGDGYQPVVTTQSVSTGLSRDMKKVPRPPEQASLRTGDRVRIEVVADKAGYVTVFNIGPTGNLNLLYPDQSTGKPPPVEANKPLHVVDVEMQPPVGRERVFALWSSEPLPLGPAELISLADGLEGEGVSKSYQSTRDMKRVQHSVFALPTEARTTAVLELNHIRG